MSWDKVFKRPQWSLSTEKSLIFNALFTLCISFPYSYLILSKCCIFPRGMQVNKINVCKQMEIRVEAHLHVVGMTCYVFDDKPNTDDILNVFSLSVTFCSPVLLLETFSNVRPQALWPCLLNPCNCLVSLFSLHKWRWFTANLQLNSCCCFFGLFHKCCISFITAGILPLYYSFFGLFRERDQLWFSPNHVFHLDESASEDVFYRIR